VLYAKLAIALILMSGVAGAIVYVQHLRAENAVLEANAIVLDTALSEMKEERKRLKADQIFKRRQIQKKFDELQQLNKLNTNLRGELRLAEKDNEQTIECLAVVPSDEFVNKLRFYATGALGNEN
jgi:uncharacterized membrane protein